MTKRNVKVVQPGLVYVIEWNAGGDISPDRSPSLEPSSGSPAPPAAAPSDEGEKPLTRRERKRLERQSAAAQPPLPAPTEGIPQPTVYVAFVSQFHLSSRSRAYTCFVLQVPRLGAFFVNTQPEGPACGAA